MPDLATEHEFQLLERQAQPTLPGPLPDDFTDGTRRAHDDAALLELFERLRIGPLTRRRVNELVPGT